MYKEESFKLGQMTEKSRVKRMIFHVFLLPPHIGRHHFIIVMPIGLEAEEMATFGHFRAH